MGHAHEELDDHARVLLEGVPSLVDEAWAWREHVQHLHELERLHAEEEEHGLVQVDEAWAWREAP